MANENDIQNGMEVYVEGEGNEVFTISGWGGSGYFRVDDSNGRGWTRVFPSQVTPVNDDSDNWDEDEDDDFDWEEDDDFDWEEVIQHDVDDEEEDDSDEL